MPRIYRDLMGSDRWKSFRVLHLETDLWIAVSAGKYQSSVEAFALERVIIYRSQLDDHIKRFPLFLTSFVPLSPEGNIPMIVAMYEASSMAGTGPMSAVAGAVAECVCDDLVAQFGFDECLVENGGDIFLKISEPATISVYAGNSPLSDKIGIIVKPHQTPLSVCCSSATVGHSLSFGTADACAIACKSGALADAYATACCNTVKNSGMVGDVAREFIRKQGVLSAVIIQDDKVGIGGEIDVTVL
ncbi:MAG TPA: UPF0280 family protein [Bacteroidales bacterium]|nr:UPF0280 family protein [Bacteroidales bacterium]